MPRTARAPQAAQITVDDSRPPLVAAPTPLIPQQVTIRPYDWRCGNRPNCSARFLTLNVLLLPGQVIDIRCPKCNWEGRLTGDGRLIYSNGQVIAGVPAAPDNGSG